MFERIDSKSLVVTMILVMIVALATAFIAAWTQRLLLSGEMYYAITMMFAVLSAFVVIALRHKRRAPATRA